MKTRRVTFACFCVIIVLICVASCTLPRRKPLELASFNQKVSTVSRESVVVRFEDSVPGKPLNQTVWDNISGPFWDVTESSQIGFTQNYKPQFFAVPPPLLPVVAKSGVSLIDSQIVVPFGNIFSNMFVSAVENTFSQSTICYDDDCVNRSGVPRVLRIKIEKFFVWEAPLNHLNLYVKGKSSYSQSGTAMKEHEFERSMLSQKLGSVLSTHSRFMDEMNRLSNQFAEDLTAEILDKGL